MAILRSYMSDERVDLIYLDPPFNFTRCSLELPSIGWQLFILDSYQSDSTAFPLSLDTCATRLLTEPLSSIIGEAREGASGATPSI